MEVFYGVSAALALLCLTGALSILRLIAAAHRPFRKVAMFYCATGILTLCFFILSAGFILATIEQSGRSAAIVILGLMIAPLGIPAALIMAFGAGDTGTSRRAHIRTVAILHCVILIVPANVGGFLWAASSGGHM